MPGDYDAAIATRRKYNAAQRRRDLADAAVDLLGTHGSRGLSHPRVDRHAGVPDGTTSFYFRTRNALLHAVAERITDLDLADLTMLSELGHDDAGYSGTLGLARLVMLSGTEPYLTRTRARLEILLSAGGDDDLLATLHRYSAQFYGLARDVVEQWYTDSSVPAELVEQRAVMVMTYISGVMTSFVMGQPVVDDDRTLDAQIRHILQ